jgi:acetyl-CoA acetyltransferase
VLAADGRRVSFAQAAEIIGRPAAVLAGLIADAGSMRMDRSGQSPIRASARAYLGVRADRDDARNVGVLRAGH